MNDMQKKPKGAGKSSFELIDPNKVKDILPVNPGAVVLDLACGEGSYSLFLSEIVGEQGLVYAVDLWKEGLLFLEEQIESRNINNIKTLWADATEKMEIDEYHIDLCLLATVLHDFEEAGKADTVLRQIKTLLKPNGHLAVIEFKKIEGPPGPPKRIRLSEEEVEKIVAGCNFKKRESVDVGDFNYMTIFQST